MARRMRGICDRIAGFPGPVIAALNGHALGGGAEFAVAADIRVACDDVQIGFNQVTLEIMPAWGGAERLAALVGRGRALLLAGTGTILAAEDARTVRAAGRGGPTRRLRRRMAFAGNKTGQWRGRRDQAGHRRRHARRGDLRVRRLWVHDEHWAAADQVMARVSKG